MKASPRDLRQELQRLTAVLSGDSAGNEVPCLPAVDFHAETSSAFDVSLSFSFANMIYASPKRLMQNTRCPHIERKHYAKNMCSACYHKTARPSRAWKCPHRHLPLYAKGRCHDCYIVHYYRRKPLSAASEAS